MEHAAEFGDLLGGKGANQAVACARLGARTAFIGKVGSDARGDEIVSALKREGIDVRFTVRDKRAATGAALIAVDERWREEAKVVFRKRASGSAARAMG